jgi:hypothetical protein
MSSSVAVRVLSSERCNSILSEEDRAILVDGLKNWTDLQAFTDDKVAQVKGVFRKVFRLPDETRLEGSTFPDAIMLHPVGDDHIFYSMVAHESGEEGAWEGMELETEGTMCWAPGVPFRLVLSLLSSSLYGVTVTTDVQ